MKTSNLLGSLILLAGVLPSAWGATRFSIHRQLGTEGSLGSESVSIRCEKDAPQLDNCTLSRRRNESTVENRSVRREKALEILSEASALSNHPSIGAELTWKYQTPSVRSEGGFKLGSPGETKLRGQLFRLELKLLKELE